MSSVVKVRPYQYLPLVHLSEFNRGTCVVLVNKTSANSNCKVNTIVHFCFEN